MVNALSSDGSVFLTCRFNSDLSHQNESKNLSSNVSWGLRKRFADGKVMFAYSNVLGFKKGENGQIAIDDEQTDAVRKIYDLFLAGLRFKGIANYLLEHNIKTPMGKDKWQAGVIRSILTNEKYIGDAILQKKFTIDFLTKKKRFCKILKDFIEPM